MAGNTFFEDTEFRKSSLGISPNSKCIESPLVLLQNLKCLLSPLCKGELRQSDYLKDNKGDYSQMSSDAWRNTKRVTKMFNTIDAVQECDATEAS